MDHTVQGDTWHDMYEQAVQRLAKSMSFARDATNLVTLSREWKTSELRHIAMATALLPNARQKVLTRSRFDCGKAQMQRSSRRLTK